MARPVLVDTSAWYALADARDAHHLEATQSLRRLLAEPRRLVTTNRVVGETYTLVLVRLGWPAATEYLRRVHASASVDLVFVVESWEEAAEELLLHYRDQDFSYVDATSFIAMRRLGLQEAFAYDHHFTIAGFTPLTS